MNMFNDAFKGKRVLVTGDTGFKGAWLCEWLLKLNSHVAGYSIGPVSSPSLFEVNALSHRIDHYEGDIRNLSSLMDVFRKFRPDVVFHLAAQPLVRYSYDQPKETFDVNVGGTVNCLEAIRQTSSVQAAVIVTTDKCYENLGVPHSYRETDTLGGKDPYSASKAAVEITTSAYIRSFFTKGPAIATVRAGNVIGGGDWATDRIIPDCFRAWGASQTVSLRNPLHVRPWQHVLEPLSGYLWLGSRLLARDSRAVGEAFNFGPDQKHCQTVKDLVKLLASFWKAKAEIRIEETPTEKAEAHFLMLNCAKAQQDLKWMPLLSFDQTAQLTADWYSKYVEAKNLAQQSTLDQITQYETLAVERKAVWALH